jgi:hypothetical protein
MSGMQQPPRTVAALVNVYTRHSHADVIVGKILEGYLYDGRERPRMRLASMYVDQFPEGDMSRALARRYSIRIFDSIEGALTLGGDRIGVDGVLLIGEHGRYPSNRRGQVLYPRRHFFKQIVAAFGRYGRVVPVFNDKHLGQSWEDARWMYDHAREMGIAFMAGSSLPVTWRRPALQLPRNAELAEAVQVGYGPLEGYGFHALECLQCLAEHRRGGETGVRSVQCLQGDAMWRALDRGEWSRSLLEAALARVPAHAQGDYRAPTVRTADAGVFMIEYRDGFRAAVAMMNGYVQEGDGGAFAFAGRMRGREEPVSTHFYLQQPDPFAHFGYLVRAIDYMVQTGHAAYPVERTLLTSGVLDAVMISRAERHRRVDTPHLEIRYQPADWPFATDPVPRPIRR